MSSGWFDCTESSLCRKQGVQGACNSSGWFKHIEPHQTYTNHIITEIKRFVEVYHMSLGRFNCTEPSVHCYRGNKECRVLMQ